MKLQIIQLEAYDDIVSVRDRLSFVQADRVLLVWPIRAQILRRKLDIVLIQREAARRGFRLALVTTDPDVIDAACDLNISTFAHAQDGQKALHWKHAQNKVFVDRSDRPDAAPDPYELRVIASRLRALTPEQRRRRKRLRTAAIGMLALAFVLVSYVILPSADVTIALAQSQIETTVQLVADPSITFVDVERGRIPATYDTITVEAKASIPTTGLADVPKTLASGTAIFTNQTNTDVPVPDGTVLLSLGTNPTRFRTIEAVTVPGGVGKTATVTIKAANESAGTAGNLDANLIVNIEGPLARSLSVRNPTATQGGTVEQQSVVTKQDYQNLLGLAKEQVRTQALTDFSQRLGNTQFVAPESIKILEDQTEDPTYSAFVGENTSNLTIILRTKVQAMIIDEQPARSAALANLAGKIPSGRRLNTDTIIYQRTGAQMKDGQVEVLESASGFVSAGLNVERARQHIAGMSFADAQNVLNHDWLLDPRRPVQIQVYPSILGRLPLLPIRINIVVQ